MEEIPMFKVTIAVEVYGVDDGKCRIDGEINKHLIAENIKTCFEHLAVAPKVTGLDILIDEIGAFNCSVQVVPTN